WRDTLYPKQKQYASFDEFWDHSLHDGVFMAEPRAASAHVFAGDRRAAAASVLRERVNTLAESGDDRFELQLYETIGLRDGAHANNPWLQELPDPVTKVTWGNHAAVAPAVAARLGLSTGDVVSIDAGGTRVELPVQVQPGQSPRTISVAVGYGRTRAGRVGEKVGASAYPMVTLNSGYYQYHRRGVDLIPTGLADARASTQTHHTIDGHHV